MAMGLAGGLASRSLSGRRRRRGLSVTLARHGRRGFVSHRFWCRISSRVRPESGDLVLPLLTHGAIWSAVGAIGGLAFGLGPAAKAAGKPRLVGGLVGAAAATIVYEIVGAVAFASSKTDLPVSSAHRRLEGWPSCWLRHPLGGWRGLGLLTGGHEAREPVREPAWRRVVKSSGRSAARLAARTAGTVAQKDGRGGSSRAAVFDRNRAGRHRKGLSIAVGADHLAAGAGAERLVGQHVDRILDEPDAPVAEGEIAPAGMIAAGIDEARPLRRTARASTSVKRQLCQGYCSSWGGRSC